MSEDLNRYQQKRYQKSISFLSFLFVFFLLSSNTVLSITQTEQKNISPVLKTGRTIYVDDDAALGGNGSIEHPFKYINEGIQNAVPGYTVYVFSGIYINEIVYIEKENITLIGENKETTILYVKDVGYDIIITANHVTVSGFTIRNYCMMAAARKILITSDFCTISDNILADEGVVICNHFIMLEGANYTIIKNNVFGK